MSTNSSPSQYQKARYNQHDGEYSWIDGRKETYLQTTDKLGENNMNQAALQPIEATPDQIAKSIFKNDFGHDSEFFETKPYVNNPLLLKKEQFLTQLSSEGKLDYKRYVNSPLKYAGGKSLAVGIIVSLLPDNIQRVASPFMGGGSVEIAIARELNLPVFGYDIFDILCTYWKVQLRYPKALAKRLKDFTPDRDTFSKVKARLKEHWKVQKS